MLPVEIENTSTGAKGHHEGPYNAITLDSTAKKVATPLERHAIDRHPLDKVTDSPDEVRVRVSSVNIVADESHKVNKKAVEHLTTSENPEVDAENFDHEK